MRSTRVPTRTTGSRSLFGRLSAMLGVALFVAGGLMLTDVRSATAAYRSDIIDPASLLLTLHPDVGSTLEVYDHVSLTGAWSIPNGAPATAGDTFSLALPPEFQPTSSVSFPLVDPADPSIVYATCSFPGAAPWVLTCTFTVEVEGKLDVGGTFAVWLSAVQTTSETEVVFQVGNAPAVVQLPGQGTGTCTGICDPDYGPVPTAPVKYGHLRTDGKLFWRIQFRNDTGSWTVSDVLTSNSPAPAHFIVPDSYQVRRILASEWANQGLGGTGFSSVIGDAVITPGAATANVTSFEIDYSGAAGDYIYWIEYLTMVSGPYDVGAVFNNTATVSGTVLTSSVVADQGGNGTGSGVTTTTVPVTTTTVPVTTTTVPVTTTTVPVTTTTTVPVTTTTVPVTTTTVPVTTTTVPVTTTTVPVTTTVPETTTTVPETTSTTVPVTTTVPETTAPTESSSTTTTSLPASGGPTLPPSEPTLPSTFPPAPLPVTGSSTTMPLLMMALGLTLTGSALTTSRRRR